MLFRVLKTLRRPGRGAALATALVAAAAGAELGAQDEPGAEPSLEMSPLSGPKESPRHHFRLRRAEILSPREAERIYAIALRALRAGYASSRRPAATQYGAWRRFNRAPYLSSTHGKHYVNNYANALAAAYGRFESAGKMPVGAIIAKDSFSVAETGQIVLGSLFLMEKMPAGFSYVTGDWRYTQIFPDGTVLGETGGPGSEAVHYCIGCHLAREKFDHLYFVPRRYRRNDD